MPCGASIPSRQQQRALHPGGYSMWEMYLRYWQPFGELLTDMEREGMLVDRCQKPSTPKLDITEVHKACGLQAYWRGSAGHVAGGHAR